MRRLQLVYHHRAVCGPRVVTLRPRRRPVSQPQRFPDTPAYNSQHLRVLSERYLRFRMKRNAAERHTSPMRPPYHHARHVDCLDSQR